MMDGGNEEPTLPKSKNEPPFRLTLREIREQDFTAVLEFYNDVETFKFATGLESPTDIGTLQLHYHLVQIDPLKSLLGIWVQDPLSGKESMVGVIDVWAEHPEEKCATIGLLLVAKDWQRKGVGTKAVEMLEKRLQQEFGTRVFRVGTIDHDATPLAFWIKLGYTVADIERNHTLIEGRLRDVIWLIK